MDLCFKNNNAFAKKYYISYYPPNKNLETHLILNDLQLGRVIKFDFEKNICHYNLITVDSEDVIILKDVDVVACEKILLIDECVTNVFPSYKINEHRYGVGHKSNNTIQYVKQNEQIRNSLATSKLLDNFIPIDWLYLKDSDTGQIATPYRCPKFQKNDNDCIFKCVRWKHLSKPLLDVDGIKFINNMQYYCETHDCTCSVASNNCILSLFSQPISQ